MKQDLVILQPIDSSLVRQEEDQYSLLWLSPDSSIPHSFGDLITMGTAREWQVMGVDTFVSADPNSEAQTIHLTHVRPLDSTCPSEESWPWTVHMEDYPQTALNLLLSSHEVIQRSWSMDGSAPIRQETVLDYVLENQSTEPMPYAVEEVFSYHPLQPSKGCFAAIHLATCKEARQLIASVLS